MLLHERMLDEWFECDPESTEMSNLPVVRGRGGRGGRDSEPAGGAGSFTDSASELSNVRSMMFLRAFSFAA